VVFTSLLDARYGRGGVFDTSENTTGEGPGPGNWAGFHFGPASEASVDQAVIAYAGGETAIEGGFANFDPVEIRQAHARVTNSRFENNTGGSAGDRNGRGFITVGTIYVRGAQPVIVNNEFLNNDGPIVNVDVNSLNDAVVPDWGRSTGRVSIFDAYDHNRGPMVHENRMTDNGTNGMEVRGGTLTTEGVWDDTDIVHVVFDEIVVPNFHHEGGLRLQSSASQSLVVKLQGANAGFTAAGRPLEIDDRIGGTLQILGNPGRPVVLTSLKDDTVGAGFQLDGTPQLDTDGTGISTGLPTGPEVDNGTLIDNDVAQGIPGAITFDVADGGASGPWAGGPGGGVTVQGANTLLSNFPFLTEYRNFVDVGSDGNGASLDTTTVTMPATLISDDFVASEGNFAGPNGTVDWRAESHINDGEQIIYNTVHFSAAQAFGDIQFINFTHEDIAGAFSDFLTTVGTPGQPDFRALALDSIERVGFLVGGFYQPGPELVNATFDGWHADGFNDVYAGIVGAGLTYSVPGVIDTTTLPPFQDPQFGQVYGLGDVNFGFAWTLDPNATTATVTTFLELVESPGALGGDAGDWRSIRLEGYSNDRNLAVVNELEEAVGGAEDVNDKPTNAQQIGQLAGVWRAEDGTLRVGSENAEKAGDDNLRLGFEVHGHIRFDDPKDVDVYSFDAPAGTEIWIDLDRTTHALDPIVELIDANGKVLARSDNSVDELAGADPLYASTNMNVQTMDRDNFLRSDLYTTNQRDPGMRLVLPGPEGQVRTYYLRMRSGLAIGNILPGNQLSDGQKFTITDEAGTLVTFELDKDLPINVEAGNVPVQISDASSAQDVANAIVNALAIARSVYGLQASARVSGGNVVLDGPHLKFNPLHGDPDGTPFAHLANTSGAYQVQIRVRETHEVPGSTVQFADIRFAINGIELQGFPGHSPLLGETAEIELPGGPDINGTQGTAQDIGNLLVTDRNTLSLAGYLSGASDIDWYQITMDHDAIQSIGGINGFGSVWATVLDIDYASNMARPDLTLWVFDSNGTLILAGGDSDVEDDQPDPIGGASVEQLSRGSVGPFDPLIGTAYLPEGDGVTYYVAVTSVLA
ncbi:MAG: PPC domain-containing protein, partial [Planctomycetota bacterium]